MIIVTEIKLTLTVRELYSFYTQCFMSVTLLCCCLLLKDCLVVAQTLIQRLKWKNISNSCIKTDI